MTPEETWKLCLNFCEKELSKQQYKTWIKPLSGDVDEKLKQLTISAPNQFVLQWVKERLNDKLHNLLEESSNISSITYNVNKKTKRSLSVEAIITESPDPKKIGPVKTNGLNKSFNFDNFVTGKANQLACAAAKQIAEKPGTTYNPLFVYGGVGLGKTHLMHAS